MRTTKLLTISDKFENEIMKAAVQRVLQAHDHKGVTMKIHKILSHHEMPIKAITINIKIKHKIHNSHRKQQ